MCGSPLRRHSPKKLESFTVQSFRKMSSPFIKVTEAVGAIDAKSQAQAEAAIESLMKEEGADKEGARGLSALATHFEEMAERPEPEEEEEEEEDDEEEPEEEPEEEEEESEIDEIDEEEERETEEAVANWHARLVGATEKLERRLTPEEVAKKREEDAQGLESYMRATKMYASREFVRRGLKALCDDAQAVYDKNPDRAKGDSPNWGRWFVLDRLRAAFNGKVPHGDETRFVALVPVEKKNDGTPAVYVPLLLLSRWMVWQVYLLLGQVGRELQAAAVRALSIGTESAVEAISKTGAIGATGANGPCVYYILPEWNEELSSESPRGPRDPRANKARPSNEHRVHWAHWNLVICI